MSYEGWTLTVAIVSAMTNVVVFAALIWQLRILREQTREARGSIVLDHDRRRKQATVEFYATTLDQQRRIREFLPHDRDHDSVAAVIGRAVDGDEEAGRSIADYLTLHNLLAVSVRSDVFDLEVIDQIFGGRLLALEANYRPWVALMRERLGYPTMYSDIEWLAHRIAARRGLTVEPRPQVTAV